MLCVYCISTILLSLQTCAVSLCIHIVIFLHFYMYYSTQSLSTSDPVKNTMLQAASMGSLPVVQHLVKQIVNVEDNVSRDKFHLGTVP